jgi:phosphate transport system permease protein
MPGKNKTENISHMMQQEQKPAASLFIVKKLFKKNPGDLIFENTTRFLAFVVLSVTFLMAYTMIQESMPSIKAFGLNFLTTTIWDPVSDKYGSLTYVFGTLYTSFISLMISIPLSIGVAVFLSEIAPKWIEQPVSVLVELLAAIPSIVYGLFGIFVLVPWLRDTVEPFLSERLDFLPFFEGAPYGFGILAASLILSIMILPIVTSISRDVMRSIPNSQREAAYALGATKWEVTKIVLAGSKSGILGAALLGLGRAVGETMAVTMVIGNRAEITWSVFDPGHTMASVIANEFTEATSNLYLSSLIEIALLLFIITIILNSLARLIVWRVTRKYQAAAV